MKSMQETGTALIPASTNEPAQSLELKFATFGEYELELLRNECEMGICKYQFLIRALRSGEILHKIKQSLKHGEFCLWVKNVSQKKLGLSHRTVNRYLACFANRETILDKIRRELTDLGIDPTPEAIEAKMATLTLRQIERFFVAPKKPSSADKSDNRPTDNAESSALSAVKKLPTAWHRAIESFLGNLSSLPDLQVHCFEYAAPAELNIRERSLVAVVNNSFLADWIKAVQSAITRDELDEALLLILGEWNPDTYRAIQVYPAVLRPNASDVRCLLGMLPSDRHADFYRAFQAFGISTVPQEMVPQLVSALT